MYPEIKRDSKLKSSINLMIVQLCMFVIPMLSVPYIVHKVGIENYGAFIFFQSVMGLLSVIGSYGFIQSGVRDIAGAKTLKRLNYEYSRIFYSKFFVLLIAVFLGMLLFSVDKFNHEKLLYSYSFLYLVMNFLDISFVYQGIEKLKDYVMVNLIGNIVYVVALFVFITDKNDYVYLPLVFAVPRIMSSVVSLLALYFRFKMLPIYFNINGIIEKMRENFSFFLTNIFAVIYTRVSVVVLGMITNNAYVGYYSIADQLVFAYSAIQGKVSTVYHPQVAYAFKNNFKDGILKAKENIQATSIMAVAVFLFTQCFAYEILYILFRDNAEFSQAVLKILSLNFIFIPLSGILAIQILLSLHKDNDLLRPSIYAAILSLLIGPVLIIYFKHVGAATACVLIETLVFGYFYWRVKSYGIDVLDRRQIWKLFKYAVVLAFVLVGLRLLYDSVDVSMLIKLPLIIILYALSVLAVLRFFDMVDFKNRRIVIEASN